MDEDLVRAVARMIAAGEHWKDPAGWVPINRYVVPSQEVHVAPPHGAGLN